MIDFRCSFLVVSSGKPCAEIEAHLMAEHRQRAGAGAVALFHAVGEHMFHQVEILPHRLLKAPQLHPGAGRLTPARRRAKPTLRTLHRLVYRLGNNRGGRAAPALTPLLHNRASVADRLEDRRPAGDLALDQRGERLWPATVLAGNVAAEFQQPLARGLVVERLVEGGRQLVEIGLGVPFGANSAFQADTWKSGNPPSFEVGTFGSAGLRSAVPIA